MRRSFPSIAFAVSTAALCAPSIADTFDIGNLSGGGFSSPRSFDAQFTGSFTDHYTFSLGSLSTFSGATSEVDGYLKLGAISKIKDLDIGSLSLEKKESGGSYSAFTADTSPDVFSFAALSAGDYRLTVKGVIVPRMRYSPTDSANGGAPSYKLMAAAAPAIAPVPELPGLLMTAMGLAGVALWVRSRRS